ncbi:MAG: 30S ribosomal protein S9, partial [Planctomycetota bacterium]
MADESNVLEAPAAPIATSGASSFTFGTGRRKSSIARVRITPGSGKVLVNKRELNDYFPNERDRKVIFGPLEVSNMGGKVDVHVNADGGGTTGQAGA